jgi:hypothetical protein
MRPPGGLLAAAALAVVAAGCGTPGPEGSVRGTVDAFLRNCGHGDGPAAMEMLVGPARATFVAEPGTRAGCARILGASAGAARVRAVAVDGELATADVATAAGTRELSLSRGREGWRIEGPH